MLLLTTTSDKIKLVTSSAADIHVHASWIDHSAGVFTPGSTVTAITSATTTDNVVGAPGASTQRNIKHLNIRNTHASTSNTVTVQFYNGTAYELFKCALAAGEVLTFDDDKGWQVYDATGLLKAGSVEKTATQATPADPAAVTVGKMMGLAVAFTPNGTRAKISITGDMRNSTGAAYSQVGIRFGTGTAPANGAADTGTAPTGGLYVTSFNGTTRTPFVAEALATGLTPGTPIWIDLIGQCAAGTVIVQNPIVIAETEP